MGGPAIIEGVEFPEFDNFFEREFTVNEIKYKSSEHYFQCQKTFNDESNKFTEEFSKVYDATAGIGCWTAGSKVKLRKNWNSIRVNIMYLANKFKIEQNQDLLELLMKTQGAVKLSESTKFWNFWNARILERVRAENRNSEEDRVYLEKLLKLFNDFESSKLKSDIYDKAYKF